MFLKEDSLVGTTIHYTNENYPGFSININSGGIYISDGFGEMVVEIGEEPGNEDSLKWLSYPEEITERETELIFYLGLHQYREMKRIEDQE
jgi:hypothetical protein